MMGTRSMRILIFIGMTVFVCLLLSWNRPATDHATLGTDRSISEASSYSSLIRLEAPQNHGKRACTRKNSIVLAKTHKTGGSTLGSILARYGHERNLSFALPRSGRIIIGTKGFRPGMLHASDEDRVDHPSSHILFNHVPFNRENITKVMRSDARYITILRNPVAQFYSAIRYFQFQESLDVMGDLDSLHFDLGGLLARIRSCGRYRCRCTYNGQAFDLGISTKASDLKTERKNHKMRQVIIDKAIYTIVKQFDLILILEHLDESLILLKNLMCWDFADILYMPMKVFSNDNHHAEPQEHFKMIEEWDYIDSALYKYFNRTLWRKISDYGPTFDADLAYFKRLRRRVVKECLSTDFVRIMSTSSRSGQHDAHTFLIRCDNLKRDIRPYTELLQELQNKQQF